MKNTSPAAVAFATLPWATRTVPAAARPDGPSAHRGPMGTPSDIPAPTRPLVPRGFTPDCTNDPEAWFSRDTKVMRTAKAICENCPLQEACRERGRAGAEFGIWGGEARASRLRARRRQASRSSK